MPSPIAHSAAGFAVYQAYRSRLPRWAQDRALLAILLFLALSLVPDLDIVPGLALGDLGAIHNSITNSFIVGIALLAVLGAAISLTADGRFTLWFGAALVSVVFHILMDYFTVGRSVMVLWPLTARRFVAPVRLFYGFHYSQGLWSLSHLWTALTESIFAAAVVAASVCLPRIRKRSRESALK